MNSPDVIAASRTSGTRREILLEICDLAVSYRQRRGIARRSEERKVLENFSLNIEKHETLGVVGESGCGKTTLLLSLLQLNAIASGQITFAGQELTSASRSQRRAVRRDMQIVFQNPYSSLDPRMQVADIIAEPLRIHGVERGLRRVQAESLMNDVGLSCEYLSAFPHELSGGQAQRVALARALALDPQLLLLDEPTSALDLSVQAQVLNLLIELQERRHLTYIFVSHDLRVVEHISDRIAVMYLGEIVEIGPTESIVQAPAHPYTRALMAAEAHREGHHGGGNSILVKGDVPSFGRVPSGCRFHTRCPVAMDLCRGVAAPPVDVGPDHMARCHLAKAWKAHAAEVRR